MEKIYIVKASKYSYDDYLEYNLFATVSFSKAKKYRAKFNKLNKEAKTSIKEHSHDIFCGFMDLKPSSLWLRGSTTLKFSDYNECYIEEIELR